MLADPQVFRARGMEVGTGLFEAEPWRRALDEAAGRRDDGIDLRSILKPVIEMLAGAGDA